ncbi:Phenol 2-monooxygenase [Choanephora cucurbitarum]|uniref:Phenol 2-monooxygenase n=1 Tax=Choanephora cucurbitarum TaxID=101091 RepID=A0A1C7NFW5_9FUNG|nr:Phenol 2-monooxygenase [Choanephora cucurbitarum]
MNELESDVFISGSGISGMYSAILFSKIGFSVHITDKLSSQFPRQNELLLFTPRSLQLLQQLGLLNAISQKGTRHHKFDIYYQDKLSSPSDQESIRLWENDSTEFNYCISCEKSTVHQLFKEHLEQLGITIDYKQEVLNIENQPIVKSAYTQRSLSSPDIYALSSSLMSMSMYYQYRPLPAPEESGSSTKSVFLKNTDTQALKVLRSSVVIGADGPTSFVRQRLGIPLRSNQGSTKSTRIFYTLQINVTSTNFPSAKQISVVCKNKDILYIIGQQHQLFVTFEHKPSWSKVSIDQEIPVQLAVNHIRSVLEPYKIEFGKVKSYTRWNGGDQSMSEEYSVDASCFFTGSAAQLVHPPGMFDVNVHLEQVRNMCWKVALNLKNRASPQLLQTFETEMKSKTEEAIYASNTLMNFIGDYFKIQEEEGGSLSLNGSYLQDFVYQLRRLKHYFVGDSLLPINTLNYQHEDDIHDDDDEDGRLNDNGSNMSGSSFVFMAPPSSLPSPHTLTSLRARPGCLAPHARVKPYSLLQLSSQNTGSAKPILSPTPSTQTSTPRSPTQPTHPKPSDTPDQEDPSSKQRSPSSVTTGNISSTILSVFQKNLNGNSKKRNSNTSPPPSPTTLTMFNERWKSIKTNCPSLSDCIRQYNKDTGFTLLIFCGPLQQESLDRVQACVRQLNLPMSFIHRYEQHAPSFYTHPRYSFGAKSLSSLSTVSSDPKSSLDTPRTSIDSHRHSASSDTYSSHALFSAPLFSCLFITSSCKKEAAKYLTDTPASVVHSTFPSGLAQVYLDHDQQCYKAYDIQLHRPEIVVIRPDGYIGTRVIIQPENEEQSFERLNMYFDSFLSPFVDMESAAAVVAASYDC